MQSIPLKQDRVIHPLEPALAYGDLRVRWGVARARAAGLHPNDDFRGLYISDEQVDALLSVEFGRIFGFRSNGHHTDWQNALQNAQKLAYSTPSPLTQLAQQFDLSHTALDLFLLALLPELDRRYERLYAYLQDDVTQKRPSVDLLLNLLSDDQSEKFRLRHELSDESALFRHKLLRRFAHGQTEPTLLSYCVRPAPRLVAHLLGEKGLEQELRQCAVSHAYRPISQGEFAFVTSFAPQLAEKASQNPILALLGRRESGEMAVAQLIASQRQSPIFAFDLALAQEEREEKWGLALREARLQGAVLLVSGWELVLIEGVPPAYLLDELLGYPHPVVVCSTETWRASNKTSDRPIFLLNLPIPEFAIRQQLWQEAVQSAEIETNAVANHFRFTPEQISAAVATAHDYARWEGRPLAERDLLAAGRTHSNQKLSELATKIKPRYRWEEIILPADTRAILQELVNTVQHRPKVYQEWGFGKKMALGKGLNALFAGESGTGKTMSADIIANVLGLDLYKIDLSSVVSKYIGETEKNLGKIFHEAETSNAVLFFDEADALFSKRSEVKDSHDRYANIETGYLLQRMEAFDGIVILATNLRANLDEAFTRRLHYIVEFPFPDVADREAIWRVNLPDDLPLAQDVSLALLAERFRIAGGSIRSVILGAAFLAAKEGGMVEMRHFLHAMRREYQKRGRLINETLFEEFVR